MYVVEVDSRAGIYVGMGRGVKLQQNKRFVGEIFCMYAYLLYQRGIVLWRNMVTRRESAAFSCAVDHWNSHMYDGTTSTTVPIVP